MRYCTPRLRGPSSPAPASLQAGTDTREKFIIQAQPGLDNLTPFDQALPERVVHVVRAFGDDDPSQCASLRITQRNYAPHGDAIESMIVVIPGLKTGVQDFAGISVTMPGSTSILEDSNLPYLASSSSESVIEIDFCPLEGRNPTTHSSALGGPFESRPLPWPGAGPACAANPTTECTSDTLGDENYKGNKCVVPCLPGAP